MTPGLGWYRRDLQFPAAWKGKSLWLDFDGTQRDATVYLNGVLLGTHDSGYTSYRFEIGVGRDANASDLALKFDGTPNVLSVHVDATNPDSWW